MHLDPPPPPPTPSPVSLQAAVEEGIVVGGGCTLLRLSTVVDAIKATLDNEEQRVRRGGWGRRGKGGGWRRMGT